MADPKTRDHKPPSHPRAEAERAALVVAFPRAAAAPVPLSGEALGRAWLEGLGVQDHEVSSRHARFSRVRGGGITVGDAGSHNGTYVDGLRLAAGETVPLNDGAVIRIGTTLLVYRERLRGPLTPAPPIGSMVGPYGLRSVALTLDAWKARPPANVLLLGETGTGKELLGEAVSLALGRGRPLALNVAAIPAGVFEAQLFGHTAGAFSDAKKASPGAVGAADGGSVFLDEIGELAIELQPKILRLLENREVQSVGAPRPHTVDVLIVAATHRALEPMVDAGLFRRDLLARLAAATVRIPPLRERAEDVFPILAALAEGRGEAFDVPTCEVEAVERLLLEAWPANVRDLAAFLARVKIRDPLPALHLWSVQAELGGPPSASASAQPLRRERVEEALRAAGGNESEAARLLGCSRGALRRFLSKTQ